jgi:hypothetical protein
MTDYVDAAFFVFLCSASVLFLAIARWFLAIARWFAKDKP